MLIGLLNGMNWFYDDRVNSFFKLLVVTGSSF